MEPQEEYNLLEDENDMEWCPFGYIGIAMFLAFTTVLYLSLHIVNNKFI